MVGLQRQLVKTSEKLTPTLQAEWILSGGKLGKKVGLNGGVNGTAVVKESAKSDRLGEVCAVYLMEQAQKEETTLAGEKTTSGT